MALLDSRPLAIFCSSRCPGSLIVQASDLAHALADRGAAVIGGFHTPVEAACLEILLAGAGPLIVCPARGMYKTIPADSASRWRPAGCSCSRRSRRPSDASRRSWRSIVTGLSRR